MPRSSATRVSVSRDGRTVHVYEPLLGKLRAAAKAKGLTLREFAHAAIRAYLRKNP